jgi:hypothetical protein
LTEDLRIRNYSPRTIKIYVRCVALFAKYFGRSPEVLGKDEIRKYQRYLVEEKKASWAFFNQTVCALRFLYSKTLDKGWLVNHVARVLQNMLAERGMALPESNRKVPDPHFGGTTGLSRGGTGCRL